MPDECDLVPRSRAPEPNPFDRLTGLPDSLQSVQMKLEEVQRDIDAQQGAVLAAPDAWNHSNGLDFNRECERYAGLPQVSTLPSPAKPKTAGPVGHSETARVRTAVRLEKQIQGLLSECLTKGNSTDAKKQVMSEFGELSRLLAPTDSHLSSHWETDPVQWNKAVNEFLKWNSV